MSVLVSKSLVQYLTKVELQAIERRQGTQSNTARFAASSKDQLGQNKNLKKCLVG